jgi:hypothetical protein
VEDTEAFLSGDFANHSRRCDGAVPGWARLNRFAHGDLQSVRDARRSFPQGSAAVADGQEETWRKAQRLLADELLAVVGGDPELLAAVQRTALVPLELQLIETESTRAVTASELVRSTRAALRSCIS